MSCVICVTLHGPSEVNHACLSNLHVLPEIPMFALLMVSIRLCLILLFHFWCVQHFSQRGRNHQPLITPFPPPIFSAFVFSSPTPQIRTPQTPVFKLTQFLTARPLERTQFRKPALSDPLTPRPIRRIRPAHWKRQKSCRAAVGSLAPAGITGQALPPIASFLPPWAALLA